MCALQPVTYNLRPVKLPRKAFYVWSKQTTVDLVIQTQATQRAKSFAW